jgi:hypothetical protein
MDVELQLRRLEQQLAAFEKMHREELEEFERKFTLYKELQADELNLMRQELVKLKNVNRESTG